MKGALNGYRLRSAHGDTIDPRQPLPIDTVEAQQTISQSETLTYNGKAAAGAVTLNSLAYKPIISIEGDQVASFWNLDQNRVYTAYVDGSPKAKEVGAWFTAVTETAGSADFSIYDPNKDLEEMFESVTGTVKRFIAKVYDKSGGTLYGWIRGVADSSNLYTFEVFNNRSGETAQNWVGTLASFDNTALEKVEIYHYNSSLVFGTATTLTEEVGCPKEYSKSWERVLEYAETLSDGQYFVDYMRGRIVGVKADTTASETVTYNIWASTASSASGATASSVKITDGTDTAAVLARTTGSETPADTDDALVVYDVGSGGASSTLVATHKSPVDGQVAYTSNVTITCSGFPFTVDDTNCTVVYILYKPSGGNWQSPIVQGAGGASISASSNVITVAGAGTPFASGDTYVVGIQYQEKGYQVDTDAQQTRELSPIYALRPNSETVLANIATNTTGYLYFDYGSLSTNLPNIQFVGSGTTPTDTLTLTLEKTVEDNGTALASCDWQDITSEYFGVASVVDPTIDSFTFNTPIFCRALRLKYVTSNDSGNDADLEVHEGSCYV